MAFNCPLCRVCVGGAPSPWISHLNFRTSSSAASLLLSLKWLLKYHAALLLQLSALPVFYWCAARLPSRKMSLRAKGSGPRHSNSEWLTQAIPTLALGEAGMEGPRAVAWGPPYHRGKARGQMLHFTPSGPAFLRTVPRGLRFKPGPGCRAVLLLPRSQRLAFRLQRLPQYLEGSPRESSSARPPLRGSRCAGLGPFPPKPSQDTKGKDRGHFFSTG